MILFLNQTHTITSQWVSISASKYRYASTIWRKSGESKWLVVLANILLCCSYVVNDDHNIIWNKKVENFIMKTHFLAYQPYTGLNLNFCFKNIELTSGFRLLVKAFALHLYTRMCSCVIDELSWCPHSSADISELLYAESQQLDWMSNW